MAHPGESRDARSRWVGGSHGGSWDDGPDAHGGWRFTNVSAAAGLHFLVVELVGGGHVNRDALGARVTVTSSDGRRRVAERRSGSSLGAGDILPLHFGLGAATVAAVEVRWPDGTVTEHHHVPIDGVWLAQYPG